MKNVNRSGAEQKSRENRSGSREVDQQRICSLQVALQAGRQEPVGTERSLERAAALD